MKKSKEVKQLTIQTSTIKNLNFKFHPSEIYFHLAATSIHILLMVNLASRYALQNGAKNTSPSYLSSIIGRERDSHDLQWQAFRKNIIVLIISMTLWRLVSQYIQRQRNQKAWIFGILFLLFAFRLDFFIYMAFLLVWYYFSVKLNNLKMFLPLCWFLVIVTLYINQYTNHFRNLTLMLNEVIPFQPLGISSRQISCGQTLNMTFLRLLSFSIDLKKKSQCRQLEKHLASCKICDDKQYCLKGRNYVQPGNYGIVNYLNYMLFVPTLLTGPPISFKNFHSFKLMPSNKKPDFLKCAFLFFTFEIFQHYLPVISLNSSQTLMQAQIFTLFHLVFIWYKFLVIWRIHKSFAQLLGIQVVDNLSRCIFNNYCFQGFWRMWHRGFNQWLIRYLYIPLGGNTNKLSVIATVAFVAFWHDHSINIVFWALTIMLFILPQIVIKKIVRNKYPHLYQKQTFKYLCALTAAAYVYFLVLANIIGFGYGISQLALLWTKVKSQYIQLLWGWLAVASCVILMFYKRFTEKQELNY